MTPRYSLGGRGDLELESSHGKGTQHPAGDRFLYRSQSVERDWAW